MRESAQRFDLRNIYLLYKATPHRLHEIVQEYVSTIQTKIRLLLAGLSKTKRFWTRYYPSCADFLSEPLRQNKPMLLSRPFITGVVVTYIFDSPDYRIYLNTEMVSKFIEEAEGRLEMIHDLALDNLRERTKRRNFKKVGRGKERMMVCDTTDGLAATRILLPELMERWARRIYGRMLIAIPNRDFLIAFSQQSREGVAAVARQVRLDATQRQHPLSSHLLTWQNGQIREYNGKG
jgi:uncharacterized protein YtpQ (UPF0354 family)